MIIFEFSDRQFFIDYTLEKLSNSFIPITSAIAKIIYLEKFSLLKDFYLSSSEDLEEYLKEHDPHVLLLDYSFIASIMNTIEYVYIGNKASLSKNVFNDMTPFLQEKYIELFLNTCIVQKDFIAVNSLQDNFFNHYDNIHEQSFDYSDYFKDIKKIISRLQEENKFYHKHFSDLQKEVVELRKINSDLNQQLQIKSMSSWY